MESKKNIIKQIFSTSLEDLDGEIWVDVIGFDGIYNCSNMGRIKSLGRFVNIRNGQRWVKERIRKQVLSKDNRFTCPLSNNGITTSINVSQTIYLSFNLELKLDISKYCVMHKNKIPFDNRLSNLEVKTISESHSVNFKKGLLPHLKENHNKKTRDYNLLTERECKICNKTKPMSKFKRGYKTCRSCQYINNSSPTYRQKKEIKIKCITDGSISVYKNTMDLEKSNIISRPRFRNILKSKKNTFKSYKNKMEYLIISVL